MFGHIAGKYVAPTELKIDTIIAFSATNMSPRWGLYVVVSLVEWAHAKQCPLSPSPQSTARDAAGEGTLTVH